MGSPGLRRPGLCVALLPLTDSSKTGAVIGTGQTAWYEVRAS
jgi:hypothetical protein